MGVCGDWERPEFFIGFTGCTGVSLNELKGLLAVYDVSLKLNIDLGGMLDAELFTVGRSWYISA